MILSAGLVIVRKEKDSWKFLFLRAYRNWDFPKGEVESGEDPMDTAKRESQEEAGITDLKFPWGHVFKETEPYRNGKKVARYYLAETSQSEVTSSINPELGNPEHHEYRWLTFQDIKNLAPERLLPIIDWAQGIIKNSFISSSG